MKPMDEEKRTSALRSGGVFFFCFSSFCISGGDDGHNTDRSVLFVSSRFRGRRLKELVTKIYNLKPKVGEKRIVELQIEHERWGKS